VDGRAIFMIGLNGLLVTERSVLVVVRRAGLQKT
jgi:hypothetical protein